MRRRDFLKSLAAGAAGLALRPPSVGAGAPPNIILFVSDDWGWPFYSFMRSVLPACELGELPLPRTPTLERLASDGICFHQGSVTAANCQPSRQSILSGLNRRDLATPRFATLTRPGIATIPIELAKVGYRTLGLGKWEVAAGGLRGSFTDNALYSQGLRRDSKARITKGDLSLLELFLADRQRDGLPWLLFVAPILPHQPFYHPRLPDYAYDGVTLDGLIETCGSSVTASPSGFRDFLGSCTWFDEIVRQIVEVRLPHYGFAENTLVLYTTDNGALLRGGKAHFSENGLRTPIIAHVPNAIPATGLHPALVGTIDLFPTILDYAGVDRALWPRLPDARSFRAVAENPTPENTAAFRSIFFSNWTRNGERAARNATYKVYTAGGRDQRFFDLADDPFENSDLLRGPALSPTQELARCTLHDALEQWWCGTSPTAPQCPPTNDRRLDHEPARTART